MSSDVYSSKRTASRSTHSHSQYHNRHRYRRRRHRRRLNDDLFDEDDNDKRDDWARRPLSPDSLWKELQFQIYLKNRMRRSMQAKSRVVDSKGRPITLAERIIRQKLLQSKDEEQTKEIVDQPSASNAEEEGDPPPQKGKKETFVNLLHQYISQREAETACSSKLLEEISDAKQSLSDNVFNRRLSSARDVCSSANISLGDSATHYNAKFRALQSDTTKVNDTHSSKDCKKGQGHAVSSADGLEDRSDHLDGLQDVQRFDSPKQNKLVVLNDSELLELISKPNDDETVVEVKESETRDGESAFQTVRKEVSNEYNSLEIEKVEGKENNDGNTESSRGVHQKDVENICNSENVENERSTKDSSDCVNLDDNLDKKGLKTHIEQNEDEFNNRIEYEIADVDKGHCRQDDDHLRSDNNEDVANCVNNSSVHSENKEIEKSTEIIINPSDQCTVPVEQGECHSAPISSHKQNTMRVSEEVKSNTNSKGIDYHHNDVSLPISPEKSNKNEKLSDKRCAIIQNNNAREMCDNSKSEMGSRNASINSDQNELQADSNRSITSKERNSGKKSSRHSSIKSNTCEERNLQNKVPENYNDDKKSEKDSAIENSDDEMNNNNRKTNRSRTSDHSSNRAYQFTGFSLERAYTLPELVPADLKEIFTGNRDLSNRERGQTLTLISSPEGSNTTITSHILPSSTYKSCLPLPPIQSTPINESSETSGQPKPQPTMKEATVSCPNMSTYRDNRSQIGSDSEEGYTTDEEIEDSGFLDRRDNASSHNSIDRSQDKQMQDTISCMFKADCKRQNVHLSYQDMPEREKRVIGLYNELKCFSLLQRSKENITIAMASRPNGLNDLHIEWGSKEGIHNKNKKRLKKRARFRKPKISQYSTKIYEPSKLSRKYNYNDIAAANPSSIASKPPWEIETKPHEFIYLRDLSFSHYVAKAVYENRLQKYMEQGKDRDSHTLRRRPRPRIKETNNSLHNEHQDTFASHHDDRDPRTSLPLINRSKQVSLISSTLTSFDESETTPTIQNDNLTQRGKKAYNKLKKRLIFPPIHK